MHIHAASNTAQSIDSVFTLRLLGALAVVCIHTLPFAAPGWEHADTLTPAVVINQLARFAVPMFFFLSGFFWGRKLAGGELLAVAAKRSLSRVARLLVVWYLVFLIPFNLIPFDQWKPWSRVSALYQFDHLDTPWVFLFEGSAMHTWYLSSLLQIIAISYCTLRFGSQRWLLALAAICFAIGLAGGAYATTPVGFHAPFNTRDSVFFGWLFFAVGNWFGTRSPSQRWTAIGIALTVGGGALYLAEILWLHRHYGASLFQDYALGVVPFGIGAGMLAVGNLQALRCAAAKQWGSVALGIYLAHPIFIELLSPVLLWARQWDYGTLSTFAVFALTAVFAHTLARYKPLRPYLA